MNHRENLYNRMYYSLKRIRRVEEKISEIYPTDKIKSPIHLSIGQEAVSVGICEALKPSDIVFGTYRGHALYLAKNGNLKKMMAELYGKFNGCAKGKAGSMHLVDIDNGVMGTSAIVASTIPTAVGYAYAEKIKNTNNIVVSFFGDGAVEEGVFFESLNFASLKKLPVLFVCENNRYAIHSHQKDRQPDDNIIERVKSFGIEAKKIGNNSVIDIYETAKKAVNKLRYEKDGPFFMECMTCRWFEHVGPNEDFDLGYRSKEEVMGWVENDQIRVLETMVEDNQRRSVDIEIETEIQEAIKYAESGAFPSAEELYTDA